MDTLFPIPVHTGIFTLGGNHFIVGRFLGDCFTTYLAYNIRRRWMYSKRPVTELSSELVAQLIVARKFQQVRWTPPAPHSPSGKSQGGLS